MLGPPDTRCHDSAAGWRVVAGAHVVTAITFGSAYAFSSLFPALQSEFGSSRGETAMVFSISAFVFYTLGLLSGYLSDRYPPHLLILTGLVTMACGYISSAFAPNILALYVIYGAGVGIGIGLSYVPAVSTVQSWFSKLRSRASGIATAGLGVGTLVLPWVTGHITHSYGWRSAFLLLAGIVVLFGIPASFLVREREPRRKTSAPPVARTLRDTIQFVRLYAVLLLSSFATFIPYVHLVPAARDIGVSEEDGTALIGLIGIGNVAGRFILASLGDRIGPQRLLTVLLLAVAGAFGIWANAYGIGGLASFAVAFGISYGGCVGLYPAVVAEIFGVERIGSTLGGLYTAVGISALLGPPLAGYAFDMTASYALPIDASAIASILAAFLMAWHRKR